MDKSDLACVPQRKATLCGQGRQRARSCSRPGLLQADGAWTRERIELSGPARTMLRAQRALYRWHSRSQAGSQPGTHPLSLHHLPDEHFRRRKSSPTADAWPAPHLCCIQQASRCWAISSLTDPLLPSNKDITGEKCLAMNDGKSPLASGNLPEINTSRLQPMLPLMSANTRPVCPLPLLTPL